MRAGSIVLGVTNSSASNASRKPTNVPVKRLDLDLPLPATAHSGDAGIDLYARVDALLPARGGRIRAPRRRRVRARPRGLIWIKARHRPHRRLKLADLGGIEWLRESGLIFF